MQSSKLRTVALGVLLLGMFCGAALGQKKDGKNHPPKVALEANQTTPFSTVRRDNLLNGLEIITLERPADIVKCDIVVRTGAMFDLTGKVGLAALTQATLLAPNPQLKEELESLQAKIEWGMNWDTTWFHIETPPSSFDAAFEIIARLLVVEAVRPDAFTAAQQSQINHIKSKTLTQAEQADLAFFKTIYGEHPYGHNLEGSELTVAGIKAGDVYDFLKRFYLANNTSIMVVGDITQEHVIKSFKVFFGGWSKGQIVPATFRQPAQIAKVRLVKIESPDAANVELRGGVIGVRRTDPDFLTTELMAQVLAGRLKRDIEAGESESSVTASPRVLSGPFFFSISAPVEKAPDASRKATEDFAALAGASISEAEIASAKMILSEAYAARAVEFYLREIEIFGLSKDYGVNIQKKIAAITAADLQRVAKRLLNANALTVVAVGKVSDNFKTNP